MKDHMISVTKSYIILHRFLRSKLQVEDKNSTEIACEQINSCKLDPYISEKGTFLYTGLLNGYLDYISSFAQFNKQINFINLKISDAFEAVLNMTIPKMNQSFEIITALDVKL